MRRSMILLIVFVVSFFAFQPIVWGKFKQLTDDDLNYELPQIHNGQVAFQSFESGEIYFWDGKIVTELSFALPGHHEYPRIHSGKIVWHGHDGNDYEIYYYDSGSPQNGILQLTDNDYDDTFPMISGTLVAWESNANEPDDNHRIRFWRDGGGISSLGNNLEYNRLLDVNGDFIVYVTGQLLGEKKLISYDTEHSGQFLNESYGADEQIEKAVAYNGFTVWQVFNAQSGIRSLHYFDWGAGYYTVKKIVEGNLQKPETLYGPAPFDFDKNQVVWSQNIGSERSIFLWDADTEVTTKITNSPSWVLNRSPSIDNGIIVWDALDLAPMETNIFTYRNGKITQLTHSDLSWDPLSTNCSNGLPMIHNGDVVWYKNDCDDSEIIVYDDFDDFDGDGIDDDIDKEPQTHSDYFDDNEIDINGTTSGTVLDRSCDIEIMDALGDAEGVMVKGLDCQSPYENIIFACDSMYVENISSDYEFVVTCGSANISVLNGSVKISLEGDNGQTATATLSAGNALMFDDTNFTLSCPTTNTVPIIASIDERKIVIDPGANLQAFASSPCIVNIDPDTLNRKSKGRWVTCYIEPPEGNDATDIDEQTLFLEGELPVKKSSINGDIFIAKFDRQKLIELLNGKNISLPSEINLKVEYQNHAGTIFSGEDTIAVKSK